MTARVSAYYRKFSDIAFAAEVATLIGADEAFAEIVREHALEPDKLTFYAPMFEARYKSITQLIAALNLSPAVIERMRPVLRVWLMKLVPRFQSGGSRVL